MHAGKFLLLIVIAAVSMGDTAPSNSLSWYRKQTDAGRLGFAIGAAQALRFDHPNLTGDQLKSCLDGLVKTKDYLWISLRGGSEICAEQIDKNP